MKMIPLEYLTDGARHLICLPYSRHNLERMARNLGIGKHWFHRDHYDIPKRRKEEIEAKCRMVSTKDIVRIINGCVTEMAIVSDSESHTVATK